MSEAFSAGLGMALGLVMSQYMLQATRVAEKVAVNRVLICQKCAAQNPIENKFCGNCGQSLFPPPQITCQKCNSKMPDTLKYCGNCGLILKRQALLRRKIPE